MNWTIPGTVLEIPRADAEHIEDVFSSIFLGGGIVLSQVSAISGLETHTVQNWVKRGFLPPPEHKRYTLRQLCRILNINMLRTVFPLERICGMLGYINGQLNDESDDIIDDSQLYFMFVKLAARSRELFGQADHSEVVDQYLEDYREPVPGSKERVRKVLNIMLTAWVAARLRLGAENMLNNLKGE